MTESITNLIGPLNGFELVVATGQEGFYVLEFEIFEYFDFLKFYQKKILSKVTKFSVFKHLSNKISFIRIENSLRKLFAFTGRLTVPVRSTLNNKKVFSLWDTRLAWQSASQRVGINFENVNFISNEVLVEFDWSNLTKSSLDGLYERISKIESDVIILDGVNLLANLGKLQSYHMQSYYMNHII